MKARSSKVASTIDAAQSVFTSAAEAAGRTIGQAVQVTSDAVEAVTQSARTGEKAVRRLVTRAGAPKTKKTARAAVKRTMSTATTAANRAKARVVRKARDARGSVKSAVKSVKSTATTRVRKAAKRR